MKKSATWMLLPFVGLLAACQTNAPASVCDGWQKLSPSVETRAFVIQNDRAFAQDVAAHNTFGSRQGCW